MRRTRSGGFAASYGAYLLAMLIFGTNGLLAGRIPLAASQTVLLRTLLGGAALTALVLLRGGFDRESVRAELQWLLPGGAALGLNWIALFEAYRLLNVSFATLLYYTGPMLVLLLSPLLFREALRPRKLAALALAAAGLTLLSGSIALGGADAAGLLTALLSALLYAALIVFNKKIVRTGGLQTACIELDVAFAAVALYALPTAGLPRPGAESLVPIAVLGLVNTGLAYLLYFSGMQKLPAQSVALLSYVDPVSALVFAALFLNESMTGVQALGAALVLGGAMFAEAGGRRTSE